MSIRIIKQGLQDTVQDDGRYGYQHLGINPGGVMDTIAMHIANVLVGNKPKEPVIEMHFPASELLFESNALVAISGGDFSAEVNGQPIQINQPILLEKGSLLRFPSRQTGARIYLAIHGGLQIPNWLGSFGTNIEVAAGGYNGRAFKKQDLLLIKAKRTFGSFIDNAAFQRLPWRANLLGLYKKNALRIIEGNEFVFLTDKAKELMLNGLFTVLPDSNRMGYRLHSAALNLTSEISLVSSAVTRGTIQLLPNGQLIVLMADHQTTGGYPRVGHICAADMATLAQKTVGDSICFSMIRMAEAEEALGLLEGNLQQLTDACTFRINEYLNK